MDAIFGQGNFKNEIIWSYQRWTGATKHFQRMHDVLLFYSASNNAIFNKLTEEYSSKSKHQHARHSQVEGGVLRQEYTNDDSRQKLMRDVWEISYLNSQAKERLGYPTQKPLKLIDRIIMASTNKGDIVLDPFCGCGTTLHAAEILHREWIGVDISQFSAGLVRNRLLNNFGYLDRGHISVRGCPLSIADAEDLAQTDRFEFEKWACGEVGAAGLYHEPGERGADGGVDGVIPFYFSEGLFDKNPPEKTYAIVQVKSGKVNPDNVRALSATVRESGAKCGVFICFEKYMTTVENNREKKRLKDITGDFNFIQGLSVEGLIDGSRPRLPPIPLVA